MTTHTAPPRHAGRIIPDGETEEVPQTRRLDERGIALQTVIIMVVLLAIAGSIAAVLLNRGGQAADQLESADFGLAASSFDNKDACQSAGHGWDDTPPKECKAIGAYTGAAVNTDAKCEALNPRWKTDGDTPAGCEPK